VPWWLIAPAAILLVAVLALAGSYIYFMVANKKMAGRVNELESESAALEKNIKIKEGEVFLIRQRIEDFNSLLKKHKQLVNTFAFLEAKTTKDIVYTSFDFNNIDKDSLVVVDGKSPNFLALAQQLDIFKKEEAISGLNLADISINEDGEVVFSLKVNFAPEFYASGK